MAIYYVRPTNGSDAAAGTSFATAFQTTQKALDVADAGDEVRLCAEATESVGTQIDFDMNAGANTTPTAASPMLITGASGTDGSVDGTRYTLQASAAITAILDPNPTYWRHVKWHNTIFDGNSNATYCVNDANFNSSVDDQTQYFANCRFTGASYGLRWRSPSGLELVDCEIDNNTNTGLEGFFSPVSHFLVGCYIHDNGSHGIHSESGNGLPKIIGCIFDTNGGSGVNIEVGTIGGHYMIVGNVFYNNTADGLSFSTNAINGGVIANNAFVSNGAYGIDWGAQSKGALYVDYNCYYSNTTNPTSDGATAPGDNNVTSDPSFTNAASGDFTPGASSPLIQAGILGTNIGAVAHAAGGGGGGGPVFITGSAHHLRR